MRIWRPLKGIRESNQHGYSHIAHVWRLSKAEDPSLQTSYAFVPEMSADERRSSLKLCGPNARDLMERFWVRFICNFSVFQVISIEVP